MLLRRGKAVAGCVLAALVPGPFLWRAAAQNTPDEPAPAFSRIESLDLPPATASQLQQDMESHDYISAEKILLPQIQQDPHSSRAAGLLDFIGGVYFLDHDYFHAAVAWNKAQSIAPLQPSLRFSLAMTYIRMGHTDWARKLLERLSSEDPKNAIYVYWLGRLDFVEHAYSRAILQLKNAISLDPGMARAYDNLGLCYYHQNQNTEAVENFRKAIDLDRGSPQPSAWPYLNLAITLQILNQPAEAEANLRQAIQLDPSLAQAHFQLGNVLERMGRTQDAISEFRQAAQLDPAYPEPHFALARLYRTTGQDSQARQEVQIYLRLNAAANAAPASASPSGKH